MHEMSLATGILGVVLKVAAGEHVREIRIRAGALQRLVIDSLQLCFELAAAGTPAADAVLTVDEVPARIGCDACAIQFDLSMPPFLCARCGSSDIAFLSGGEVSVDGIELDSGWLYRLGASESPLMLAADLPADDDRRWTEQIRVDALGQGRGAPV